MRFQLKVEDFIITRLVSQEHPGILFKYLFKVPVIFYKMGLPLFGNFILLLTTTGRKSGKERNTPLEYFKDEATGDFIIMAGWGGNTDWRKNVDANPRVKVQAGKIKFDAIAERLNEPEVIERISYAMQVNPASAKIWSKWAGESVSLNDPQSIARAVKHFPTYRLKKEG